MSELEEVAFWRGVEAFDRGQQRVPFYDGQFIESLGDGQEVLARLDAWLKGWDMDNLGYVSETLRYLWYTKGGK